MAKDFNTELLEYTDSEFSRTHFVLYGIFVRFGPHNHTDLTPQWIWAKGMPNMCKHQFLFAIASGVIGVTLQASTMFNPTPLISARINRDVSYIVLCRGDNKEIRVFVNAQWGVRSRWMPHKLAVIMLRQVTEKLLQEKQEILQ